MYLVFESEMLHHREYWVKSIESLCRGRHLPVEVPGLEIYAKGTRLGFPAGVKIHKDVPPEELKLGTVKPDILCVHKLQEMREEKAGLADQVNFKLVKVWSGDPANDFFQISADTSKPKPVKARKNGTCEIPVHIAVGNTESMVDDERLQLWH
jgi:hypothetical protein